MANKRKIIFWLMFILLILPKVVSAVTFSNKSDSDAQSLVNHILGSGLEATNVTKKGTVYTFSGGMDDIGIDSGIILDTSGSVSNSEQDPDLASLMDYNYGGDTASLEFSMTATGNFLNFNYVFASGEFVYGPQYNDVFGLFISVNGGDYENIAIITRDDESQVPVNISNLKAGLSGNELSGNPTPGTVYSLFSAKGISGISVDGVSNVFNAQKTVNKGDLVKIKFVIADVSDSSVDSYVMIEAGSLSFDPPGGKIDYEKEFLRDLEPNTEYKIIDDDITFDITSNADGKISLIGKDNNDLDYNFIGKTIQIIKKGVGDIPDSDAQEITVNTRPDIPEAISEITGTPKDILLDDLIVTQTEIIIIAEEGQEYSIDNITWHQPDSEGCVIFNNLEPNKEYTVYTRIAPTNNSFASDSTSGTKIVTKDMVKNLNYITNDFEGYFDGKEHYAFVLSDEDVDIKYSEELYGTYKSDVLKYALPGRYTVYYSITKEGYYPAYGTLTVSILGLGQVNLYESPISNPLNMGLDDTLEQLIPKLTFSSEELDAIKSGKNVSIYLEVKDISNSILGDDKEKFVNQLEPNDKIGFYLDVNLLKIIDDEVIKVSEVKDPVTITFEIPEELINKNSDITRIYGIYLIHDGKISKSNVSVDGNIGTFVTDKFSTYLIIYSDIISEEENVIVIPNSGVDVGSEALVIENPQTNDNILMNALLFGLSLFVLMGIGINMNKKHNKLKNRI